jgi:hypothetical protein
MKILKYIHLAPIKSSTAMIIERKAQKKLAKVNALELEYPFNVMKETIQITSNIKGKNNPSVVFVLMNLKVSNILEVSFIVGVS